MGFTDFTAGAILTDTNLDLMMRQGVMTFASTAARDTALSGVLAEGMFTYQTDTNTVTYYTGSAWRVFYRPVTSWAPTWTNLTVGNGTQASQYSQVGDTVFVQTQITFGSTTSVTGTPVSTNCPVTLSSFAQWAGSAVYLDLGTRRYGASVWVDINGAAPCHAVGATGSITSTEPFTWTTGDFLHMSYTYTAA